MEKPRFGLIALRGFRLDCMNSMMFAGGIIKGRFRFF